MNRVQKLKKEQTNTILNNTESKALQYFGNMSHSSVALDAFAKAVKVEKTLVCRMPSSPDTFCILLARFNSLTEHSLRIYGFRPT